MPNLDVTSERRAEAIWVRLAGELDMTECTPLEAELILLESEAPALLVLDLSALTFIDSYGLRALIAAQRRAEEAGRRLALVRPPDMLFHVFRITLLDQRFDWVEPGAG